MEIIGGMLIAMLLSLWMAPLLIKIYINVYFVLTGRIA